MTTHRSVGFADQLAAAEADAARAFRAIAAAGGWQPNTPGPILTRIAADTLQQLLGTGYRACPHVDAGPRPAYVYAAAPSHGLMCALCALRDTAMLRLFGTRVCDGCGQPADPPNTGALNIGLVIIAFAVCAPCATADATSETGGQQGNP